MINFIYTILLDTVDTPTFCNWGTHFFNVCTLHTSLCKIWKYSQSVAKRAYTIFAKMQSLAAKGGFHQEFHKKENRTLLIYFIPGKTILLVDWISNKKLIKLSAIVKTWRHSLLQGSKVREEWIKTVVKNKLKKVERSQSTDKERS